MKRITTIYVLVLNYIATRINILQLARNGRRTGNFAFKRADEGEAGAWVPIADASRFVVALHSRSLRCHGEASGVAAVCRPLRADRCALCVGELPKSRANAKVGRVGA
jgi:hypothetical protein